MPRLQPNGELTLSSHEVKDLRAMVYQYGLDIERGRVSEAVLKIRAIRTVLVTLEDGEDE